MGCVCVSSWVCLLGGVCVLMGMPVGCVYVYVGWCHCGYACWLCVCVCGGVSLWVSYWGVCLSVIMDLPVGCVCACLSLWPCLLGDERLSVIVGMPVGVGVLVILV